MVDMVVEGQNGIETFGMIIGNEIKMSIHILEWMWNSINLQSESNGVKI
jgi:hypothetical protein